MGKNGSKIKLSSDLLEYFCTNQFESAAYEPEYSKPKFEQISNKAKIYFDLIKNLHMSKCEGNKNEYGSNILRLYI